MPDKRLWVPTSIACYAVKIAFFEILFARAGL